MTFIYIQNECCILSFYSKVIHKASKIYRKITNAWKFCIKNTITVRLFPKIRIFLLLMPENKNQSCSCLISIDQVYRLWHFLKIFVASLRSQVEDNLLQNHRHVEFLINPYTHRVLKITRDFGVALPPCCGLTSRSLLLRCSECCAGGSEA